MRRFCSICLLICLCFASVARGTTVLQLLPNNIYVEPYALSGDGTIVTGRAGFTGGEQAFRWSPSIGLVPLGDLPGDVVQSRGQAISTDGLTVVGQGSATEGS